MSGKTQPHPHLIPIHLICQILLIRLVVTHAMGLSAFPEPLIAQLDNKVIVLTDPIHLLGVMGSSSTWSYEPSGEEDGLNDYDSCY